MKIDENKKRKVKKLIWFCFRAVIIIDDSFQLEFKSVFDFYNNW